MSRLLTEFEKAKKELVIKIQKQDLLNKKLNVLVAGILIVVVIVILG